MAKNEAETRYELIDPILRDKGYRMPYVQLGTPAPVEATGAKGRRRPGPGKTDYLLCVEIPNGPKALPVAILESKKEDEHPLKGMQQAKGYSDREALRRQVNLLHQRPSLRQVQQVYRRTGRALSARRLSRS